MRAPEGQRVDWGGKMLKDIVLRGVTLLAVAAALGCAQNTAAPAQQPTGASAAPAGGSTSAASERALVIALRGELPSLAARPLTPFSMALYPPLFLFNAMLDYQDENGVVQPYLGEGLPKLNTDTWKVFPDGRMETTYHLRPHLTWHDGAPLSAEDFVFAWRVYATPALGGATSPPVGLMEEVGAPDDQTLTIRWRQTYPGAASMADGTQVGFQALPRHILEDQFRDLDPVAFSQLPFWTSDYVGLGPFRVDRWEPGISIGARAFDNYVFGRPKIDRIELRVIPDPQTAVANLLAGETQFVSDFILSVTEGQTL